MNTPLHNIKDARQLDYVIKAIERADYELVIARHRLLFLFPNSKDAYDALTQVHDVVQFFVRNGPSISAAQKADEDND